MIIYELKRIDCPAIYVGQTARYLILGISEQRRDCRLGRATSVIANRCTELDHSLNFEEPTINATEPKVSKKLKIA